jgi:chemotaxis signal transduction protein
VSVTPVPGADPRVAGLMNLRGKSATVVDLRRCFRTPTGDAAPTPKMILLETADRLTDQARTLGIRAFVEPVVLLVDRILDIIGVQPKEVQPRPAHVAERFIIGVLRHAGAYVSLLDLNILLDDILHPGD